MYEHTITTGYPVTVPTPGQTVVSIFEPETRLTVLRIEPMVVCQKPDGSEVQLFAHEVEVQA